MDWRRTVRNRWALVVGFTFSAPSIFDDFTFWQGVVGQMSPAWTTFLAGVGTTIIGLWFLGTVAHYGDKIGWLVIRAYARALAGPIIAIVLMAVLAGGLIYYVKFVHEPMKTVWVWTHPTATPSDREEAEAECEMAAFEAIGGGRGGLMDPKPGERWNYKRACMTTRGFKLVQMKADSKGNGS